MKALNKIQKTLAKAPNCGLYNCLILIIGIAAIYQCENNNQPIKYQYILKPISSIDNDIFHVDSIVYAYTEYRDSIGVNRKITFSKCNPVTTKYTLFQSADTIYLGTVDGYGHYIKEPYLTKGKNKTVQYVSFNGNSSFLGGITIYQKDTVTSYCKRNMVLSKYLGREVGFNSASNIPFYIDSKGRTIKISCFELRAITGKAK